jgi:hypothetical protein
MRSLDNRKRRYERELYETYFVPNNTTLIFNHVTG